MAQSDVQRAYRQRIAQKLVRAAAMEAALAEIIAKLEGRDKPLTNEIREIALRGLDGDQPR